MAENNGQAGSETVAAVVKPGKKAKKKMGFLKFLFIFGFTISVMLGVMGGTVYYVLKNNVNGIVDKNRVTFMKTPIIKNLMPPPIEPDSDEYFSDKELREKYKELLQERNKLRTKVEELTKGVSEIDKVKQDSAKVKTDSDAIKTQTESLKTEIEKDKKQLEEDKKKFYDMVARKDTKGFEEFFMKIDKATAENIYKDVVTLKKADVAAGEMAKVYNGMDATASAKILQEMGNTNMDLVIGIMKNLKKDMSAEVLAAMDTKFASKVSEKIKESY